MIMERKNKLITINSKTSEVFFDNGVLGIDNENLTGNLIFRFSDEFIDGTARLEIQIGDNKSYTMLSKEDESYTLPIKNFLTKTGKVYMELVITSGTDPENPIVWKSNIFYLIVNKAINAEIEEDENYTQWIDEAEARLNVLDASITQANNLDIDASKIGNTATITITKKDGTEESINIYDGQDGTNGNDGRDGADAKINGVNTLTLEAGDNITLEQEGSTLTISSTASGGTTDYANLENKPSINGVTLNGNKTTSDLGINIPDVSNFITKDVNNLTYYTKTSDLSSVATSGNYNDLSNKPTIPTVNNGTLTIQKNNTTIDTFTANSSSDKTINITVPTDTNDLTNGAGYTTNTGTITSVKMNGTTVSSSGEADLGTVITDISGKQDTIDSSHKLSSDLVDDTNNTNKFVSTSEKTTWSGKQDALVSGTNIKTINNTSILGSGNIEVASNVEIDESTITLNASNKLQTVGVKDVNTTNTDKIWSGTLQQYNAIQNKDADTFYYITDDYVNNAVPSGGTTGQILSKASGTDFDTEWVSQHSFSHETWTFTLEDDTTVDKEVVLW